MTIPTTTIKIAAAALLIAGLATTAFAQSVSGGRQGPNGHGYSYSATKSGGNASGAVTTNGGYGATANHTTSTTANGVKMGRTTVNTANGSSLTTQTAAKNGYVAGAATATGPSGQSVSGAGGVYVSH